MNFQPKFSLHLYVYVNIDYTQLTALIVSQACHRFVADLYKRKYKWNTTWTTAPRTLSLTKYTSYFNLCSYSFLLKTSNLTDTSTKLVAIVTDNWTKQQTTSCWLSSPSSCFLRPTCNSLLSLIGDLGSNLSVCLLSYLPMQRSGLRKFILNEQWTTTNDRDALVWPSTKRWHCWYYT